MLSIPKKAAAILATAAIMTALSSCGVRPIDPTMDTSDDEPVSAQIVRIPEAEAASEPRVIDGDVVAGELIVTDADRSNLFDYYRLPALERMEAQDADELVYGLQSVKRVSALGFDTARMEYPEYWFKEAYNGIMGSVAAESSAQIDGTFTGSTASELNAMIAGGGNYLVASREIEVDEPVSVPSGTSLVADGCRLVSSGSDRAFDIVGAEGITVSGFDIDGHGFDYGIFVDGCSDFVLSGNEIRNVRDRAVAILHECHSFLVLNNVVENNGRGGIFCCGDIHDGVFEGNSISYNLGSANSTPGLFLGNFDLVEDGTAKTQFLEPDLDSVTTGPHSIVVYRNTIEGNLSQGIYSHMGWGNFIVSNDVSYNHKEGTCLDYGTIGTYVSNNMYVSNGHRIGVDDGEPEFNKLPGISMDNACYNVIKGNVFARQGGTGIKAVRSSCRNVIVDNTVEDNNQGVSENGHFFGIELASDMNKDYEGAKGMDFAPCFENIIARNTISGPHYAGIYMGNDDYVNDAFNNVIMGASDFSIEVHSQKFNSIVDNIIDMPEFYDGAIIPNAI